MKNPKRIRNMIIVTAIFVGVLFLLLPRTIVIYGVSDGTYATDDGKYIYKFKVPDNDTLTFVQHGSICPENISIDDETEFKYVEDL